MTSIFARAGALDTRFVSQTIRGSGKRKRGEWICADCRNRRPWRQRRGYGDDAAVKWGVGVQSFFDRERETNGQSKPSQSLPSQRKSPSGRSAPWALSFEDNQHQLRKESTAGSEAEFLNEQQQIRLWEESVHVEEGGAEDSLARTQRAAAQKTRPRP